MNELRIKSIAFDQDHLTVRFTDGNELRISLAHFPRLRCANAEARNAWELIGRGRGVHWEIADEDLSVENLLTAYSRDRTGNYAPLTK